MKQKKIFSCVMDRYSGLGSSKLLFDSLYLISSTWDIYSKCWGCIL